MKDHLEQSIRESLQGFEAPYNPAAWDAMRAKLDAKMPVSAPKGGGNAKWYIAAAVVTGIAVTSYFVFSPEKDQPATEEVTLHQESDSNGQTATSENTTAETSTPASAASGDVTGSSTVNQTPVVSPTHTNSAVQPSNSENPFRNVIAQSDNTNSMATPPSGSGPGNESPRGNTPARAVILPEVGNVCQNEIIEITNSNDVALNVIGPEFFYMIPAGETRKFRAANSGVYHVSAAGQNNGRFTEFTVKSGPNVDFLVDPSLRFENGLPTVQVEATVSGSEYQWVINNQRISGHEAEAHFYTKGNHDVTLTVTGANGCKTSTTKAVYIEETYNLMAMNSFRPNSSDPLTNTFMPYALKERNVNFKMIIIDPRDGHILFETSDASRGWDGIDAKTGTLVPLENSYIWKVTLDKKAPGEVRNEYSGQVIPVHSSK